MGTITLFFTSLGLSMDACAVSISNGMSCTDFSKKQILTAALAFGFFQALMPIIGYTVGQTFSTLISSLDHWIALVLLCFIGGKMISEAIKELKSSEEVCLTCDNTLTYKKLLAQSIATSIDALAVGIGFGVMKVNILYAALSIGSITFICSVAGSYLGIKCGQMFKQKAEILGGGILVFIGLKIFLEHMLFI